MSGNTFLVLVSAMMVACIQPGEARGTYSLVQPQYYAAQPEAQYVYVPQAQAYAAVEHAQQFYQPAPMMTCYCYGHSHQCAAQGVCANCQHNTIGNMCQYCRPGYSGMATRGTAFDCQPNMQYQYMQQYYYQPQGVAVKQHPAAVVQAEPMHVKQAAAAVVAPTHVKDAAPAAAFVAPAYGYGAPPSAFKQPE